MGLFFDMASTEAVTVPPARGKKSYDGCLEDLIMPDHRLHRSGGGQRFLKATASPAAR
jgi:hypothetical protein